MSSENISSLKVLSEVIDRISHASRTNLGVGISAIDDQINGIELNDEDLADALNSLRKILNLLDQTKVFTNLGSTDFQTIDVNDLVGNLKLNEVLKVYDFKIVQKLESSRYIKCCNKLLEEAIALTLLYFNSIATPSENSLETDIFSSAEGTIIEFRLPCTLNSDLENLSQLIEKDHSPNSLGLIFAREVFALHSFECLINGSASTIRIQFAL